jgi:hypothetical protein
MFVIIVGIAGVMSSIYWGLQHQDSGKIMSEASNHAKLILERIAINGYVTTGTGWPTAASGINDPDLDTRRDIHDFPFAALEEFNLGQSVKVGSTTAGSQNNFGSGTDRFTRNIQTTRLTPTNPPNDDYKSSLARVDVRVYWFEKKYERKVLVQGVFPHANP